MTHKTTPCVLFLGHVNNDPDQNSEAYEQGRHCLLKEQNLDKNKKYQLRTTCADPESFIRGGQTFFLSPNTTKIGPSSARQQNVI